MNKMHTDNLESDLSNKIIPESNEKLPVYYNKLRNIYIFSILLYFALNFLGSPLLKPLFAIITIETIFISIILPWNFSCLYLTIFLLIESQGRILWGYNPFFRLSFDGITFICILRVFIKKKKVLDLLYIPKLTLIFIILHFLWFFVELFNPLGPGIIPTLITSKYFIFPFILYFCSLLVPIDFNDKYIQQLIQVIVLCILLEAVLAIFQMGIGQDYFFNISPNFLGLFKKMERFQGANYRPWGTARDPGGYSVFIFYLAGHLFLYSAKVRVKLYQLYITAIVLICIFANFASSIRSALLKFVAIVIAAIFIKFLSTSKKIIFTWKLALGVAAAVIISIALIGIFPNFEKQLNLGVAVSRLTELTQKDGIAGQRASPAIILDAIINQVEYPFGFGPGMCTKYLPQFAQTRSHLSAQMKRNYWTHDNLYLSLFLELGLGALFYIGAILSIPLVLLSMSIHMYRNNKAEHMFVTTFGALFTLVVIMGNWGAIAIPFNPTSFMFWFWAAQACHNYYKYFPKETKVVTI